MQLIWKFSYALVAVLNMDPHGLVLYAVVLAWIEQLPKSVGLNTM